ncbi:MAG: hypothetical protein V5A72_00140, partial [Candidatus Nanohaloarchaea archaeon]
EEYPLMDAEKPDISIDRLTYILKDAAKLKQSDWSFYGDLMDGLPGRGPEEDSFRWNDIGDILEATEIQEEYGEKV